MLTNEITWRILAAAACLLLLFFSPAEAALDDDAIRVHVEADAPGVGLAARAEAMGRAKTDILRQVAETVLLPRDLSLVTGLFDQPDKYIRSTQLLAYRTEGSRTQVEVECYVKRYDLLRDLARTVLPSLLPPPTVLVLVAEQIGGDEGGGLGEPGIAGPAFTKALRKAGLDPVDTATVRACYSDLELIERIGGDRDTAGAFARQGFAEVVVLGEAVCKAEAPSDGANVFANTADIRLRILRGIDGALIEAIAQQALVHSTDPAEGGAFAVRDACAKLESDLITYATLAAAGSATYEGITITVEEPGNRGRFDQLVQVFEAYGGGGEADVLFYTDRLARFRVGYEGLMAPLMDEVTTRQYGDRPLSIRRAVGRNVVLRFSVS
ncbi:MAG: hypothetical protein GWP08_16085 [Nitrospiraceae bacterium]|nr:hypothetical protein [Nitrospiraceae bacterium]